jgi:hypothetical protein
VRLIVFREPIFTYDSDHKDYDETIEYELPGMGHSVEANVETRVPKSVTASVPDLIQVFRYSKQPLCNVASALRSNAAFPDGNDVGGGKNIVLGVSGNPFSLR